MRRRNWWLATVMLAAWLTSLPTVNGQTENESSSQTDGSGTASNSQSGQSQSGQSQSGQSQSGQSQSGQSQSGQPGGSSDAGDSSGGSPGASESSSGAPSGSPDTDSDASNTPVPPTPTDNSRFGDYRSRFRLGATMASPSAAPAMLGDYFGGSFLFVGGSRTTISLAGGDRRFKIAENSNVIPQNRVYFSYHHFHNALQDYCGKRRSMERFNVGVEKAICDDALSFEIRMPISRALNSTVDRANFKPMSGEFGNVGIGIKSLLRHRSGLGIAIGATATLPTGDDYVQEPGGANELVVNNDAVHVAPYFGWVAEFNDAWFCQGFVQSDIDLGGNGVFSYWGYEGQFQEQTLLFVDASVGRWILSRNGYRCLAAIGELHYTTTLNDPDFVYGLGNQFYSMDILNASFGLHFQGEKRTVRIGGSAPLRDAEESLFDAEFFIQINRHW